MGKELGRFIRSSRVLIGAMSYLLSACTSETGYGITAGITAANNFIFRTRSTADEDVQMTQGQIRIRFRPIFASAAILFLGAGAAQATCLYMDWNDVWRPFVNTCNVGIDFDFSDQGSCRGWSCSGYVAPYGRFQVGNVTGTLQWVECQSPGGNGDVIAVCDSSGNCSCRD